MKNRISLLILTLLFWAGIVQAQTPQPVNSCAAYTVITTGYVPVFIAAPGQTVQVQAGYYTSGSPASVSTLLAGGYVSQVTSNPFDLGTASTNTTSADLTTQTASYPIWYIHTATLSAGGSLNYTVCVNSVTKAVTQQVGSVITTGTLTTNSPVLGAGAGNAPVTVAGMTSNGDAQLVLGTSAAADPGTVKLFGTTSGSVTIGTVSGALGSVTANFPAGSITVPGTVYNDCSTANACSATNESKIMKVVTGVTAVLDGATPSVAAVTGMPAFTSVSSYHCTATGTGGTAAIAAGGVAVTNVSSSAVTFTSAAGLTNTVHYICIGW